MQREGYRLTALFEERHWWFRARRDLFLRQVAQAVGEVAVPGHTPRILDYGCGTGYNLPFLARYGEVWGADIGIEAAAEFRRLPEGGFVDLDGDLAPHKCRFDVVTALDVIEHLYDDVAGLVAMRELVRPGGQIVLTVPAYRWLWSGEDVISEHKRRYTRQALLRCCRAAGFTPRFVSYFNLAILPAATVSIWSERWRRPGSAPRSNLRETSPRLNEWLYRLASHEARWVGDERVRLPAGASLVARCAS